jgi:hypothetical protein
MQESFRFLDVEAPDLFFRGIAVAAWLAHLSLGKKHAGANPREKHDAGKEYFHGQGPFPLRRV